LVAPSTTRRAHPERNAAVFRMKSKDARRSAQGAKMTTIGECTPVGLRFDFTPQPG